ncbi:hypothetical protein PVAND_007522 [Polypedilum vanderplanki]|uniref:Uncharacterized protein n=1 Tax=Polypedilum vanderplanki TaxID=319348 RepID=A0A9J6C7G0_POLVA|nr:hypothetical protein PVAND_007522 [Polypedilum vanderplanki]
MAKIVCLQCFNELSRYDKIFSCSKKHNFCAPCGKSMHLQCECYESLHLLTIKNSIEEEVQVKEKISNNVECLGNLLKIWECNWCGTKSDFPEHFIRCHNHIEIFSQFQVSSVPFQSDQFLKTLTLVQAFDCNFIFYYHTNPTTKMIYFLIFLLNEQEQPKPQTFLYELMIKSPKENHCKIKFVEKCFVFDDDIERLRDKEMCAAVTFQTIEKHLDEGHIHFSFLIKKNCKETLNIKAPVVSDNKNVVVAKSSSHTVPSKGILKSNNARKSQSIPSDPKPPTIITIRKEVEEDPLKNLPTKQNSQQPPDYSSINKQDDERHFKSPAHCTSAINRNDDDLSEQGTTKADECYHFRNVQSQSYKTPDHKIYRQKYPESCLSKPILRK